MNVREILKEIEEGTIKYEKDMECPKCEHMGLWYREGYRCAGTLCAECGHEDGDNTYY